jgi:hypothetical protein
VVAAEPTLPLEKVVLFTSGVGYFQHAGEVTDDASVEMTFKAEEVNDLLKSMVVEDAGGAVEWSDDLAGLRRFFCHDPFGNRLEFIGSIEDDV